MFYLILLLVWVVAYWFGAAKIAYDQTGSGLWALLAFMFAPLYYPYFAFFVSKPVSAPMMGGSRGGIAGKIREGASLMDSLAKAVLKVVPKRV